MAGLQMAGLQIFGLQIVGLGRRQRGILFRNFHLLVRNLVPTLDKIFISN